MRRGRVRHPSVGSDGTFIIIIGRSTDEMNTFDRRRRPRLLPCYAVALVLALTVPFASHDGAAEIPHENYDLVESDIDLVVAMLNASIRASEDTLRYFYEEDIDAARSSIDIATSVVGPAEAILEDIEDVAGSHEQLIVLIPPFSSLQDGMRDFADLEEAMLGIREEIVAIASELNITDSEAIEVIDSIRRINAVLSEMNDSIETMLLYAGEIDSLAIDDWRPFVPNDLSELIERLRELVAFMGEDIIELIEEGIPWQDDRSFLLLWIVDPDLYLGEELSGGGYFIRNGTLIVGSSVDIFIDDIIVATRYTDDEGAFSFSHTIPLDVVWLGSHDLTATTAVSGETTTSETLVFNVSLVPTDITLLLSNATVALSEDLVVEVVLTREPARSLPGASCVLSVDGSEQEFVTDDDGRCEWTWRGSTLGLGAHVFSARFPLTLPFASCDSGEATMVVDVPTSITLNLFSDRLRAGYYLIGDGILVDNVSSPMAGQRITLSIDGESVTNVTTDSTGKYAFSIDTLGLAEGGHVLVAAFEYHDPYWRSSEDEAKFVIISMSYSEYPFLPWIPGWDTGGGLTEQIPYLFFGEYAYFTWLFILSVAGVVIKALQVRKAKARSETAAGRVSAGDGTSPAVVPRRWGHASLEHMPDWLVSPNEKVIWHYHSLLAFLKDRVGIGVTDDMTHWEVARLLGALGYPQGDAGRVALLYEKAQYSGTESSEDDVQSMGASSGNIRLSGGVRPAV